VLQGAAEGECLLRIRVSKLKPDLDMLYYKPMNIPFTKMHGLGNDFILIEEDQLSPDTDLAELSKLLCDRHFGIGADGLIIVAPPDDPASDIQFKIFNNDGSVAEMCGNGVRCFARYVKDQGLIKRPEFKVETLAGPVIPHINADATVTVDMGRPVLNPEKVPFNGTKEGPVLSFPLQVTPELTLPIAAIGMGNPHCIIFRDDVPQPLDFKAWGPQIEVHPLFPAKTNVEFVEVLDRSTLEVKVWERGVGATLACGSGACAVATAAILRGLTDNTVTVQLPGGDLKIQWNGKDSILMTGPATYVFAGMFPFASYNMVAH
jgi:diaminopimelate epimerase